MSRLALLPLLLAACLVSGQVQQTFIYSGMSLPTACPATNRLFILTPTGDIYSCPVAQGPWVLKASGSVSGVVLLNPPADQTIVSSAQQSLILNNAATGSIYFNPNDPVFGVPTFVLDSKAGATWWGFYFNGTPEFFIDTNIDSSLPGNPTELSFSEQKTLTDDMQLVNGDTYIGGNLSLGTLSEGPGQAGKGNLATTGNVNIGAGKTYQVNGTQIGCGNLLGAGSLCSSSATLPANTPAVTHDFFTAYNSGTGVFSKAQPACGDLSDSGSLCTSSGPLPSTAAATTHQWINSYTSGTGAFTKTQPACGDLSDSASGCSTAAGANTALSNLSSVAVNAALNPGSDNSIALNDSSHRYTDANLTAAHCGIAGTTSCVITGAGSTSGTATLTWPATAGTTTNPIASSNSLRIPAGTVYQISTDTGISRDSVNAGQIQVGNGSAGDATGTILTTNYRMASASSTLRVGVANILLYAAAAPTISSGFGTTPSIAHNNGTAAFTINVGTGGVATSGVIGLATATTGWVCSCTDISTQNATVSACKQTATSTTTATVGNFTDLGAAGAWAASDILQLSCFAY